MIAVTIGTNPYYLGLAERAADTVRRHTGLPTFIITEYLQGPASCCKLTLFERWPGEDILYFDADTYTVASWDPREYIGEAIGAVADVPSQERDAECTRFGIDPQRYFNCGLLLLSAGHDNLLREAARIYHDPGYETCFQWEQTALNAAVARLRVPLNLLPACHNAYTIRPNVPKNAIMLHAGGGSKDSDNRPWFEECIRAYASAAK